MHRFQLLNQVIYLIRELFHKISHISITLLLSLWGPYFSPITDYICCAHGKLYMAANIVIIGVDENTINNIELLPFVSGMHTYMNSSERHYAHFFSLWRLVLLPSSPLLNVPLKFLSVHHISRWTFSNLSVTDFPWEFLYQKSFTFPFSPPHSTFLRLLSTFQMYVVSLLKHFKWRKCGYGYGNFLFSY